MKSSLGLFLIITLLVSCGGGDSVPVVENIVEEVIEESLTEQLLPATIALQSIRLNAYQGFNNINNNFSRYSFTMLLKMETMLMHTNDNKDILIDIIATLTAPFSLTTSEPITTNAAVSSTTAPFSINATALTNSFLLLSSSTRYLTEHSTLKTRFKTSNELNIAWLRAVEYSDQRCLYVKLQSVDVQGEVTAVSNTLVVVLDSNETCAVQL